MPQLLVGYFIIPVNPRSTQIWRRLDIFRGTNKPPRGVASRQNLRLHWRGGGEGGKRGTVHCLIPLCPPPHSPCGFAVAQNFTKRDPTITPATQATTFMKKTPRLLFTGRFGGLTGRPGDLIKNLETPGKTGRVGRYVLLNFGVLMLLTEM